MSCLKVASAANRPSKHEWVRVGSFKSLGDIAKTHPPSLFDYGVQYNSALGAIHRVVLSSWGTGVRVATVPPYPTGDTGTTMAFGQAVFTQGLDDATDKQAWHHYYYTENANGASAGATSHI